MKALGIDTDEEVEITQVRQGEDDEA